MDEKLLSDLKILKNKPSPELVVTIIECPTFESIFDHVINQDGDFGKILVSYLKDVSLFLCLIQAVRQSDIDLHLGEERKALPLLIAYNH